MIEVVEQIEEMVPYYIAEGSAVYLARKISDNGEAEIYTIDRKSVV